MAKESEKGSLLPVGQKRLAGMPCPMSVCASCLIVCVSLLGGGGTALQEGRAVCAAGQGLLVAPGDDNCPQAGRDDRSLAQPHSGG